MLGAAGAWFLSRGAVSQDGHAAADQLIALPGKKPLIKRTFRPPNFETPTSALASTYTPNELFFVRYHLAVIPEIDTTTWRLQVGGVSVASSLSLSLEDLHSG